MATTRMWRGIELRTAPLGARWPSGAKMEGRRGEITVSVGRESMALVREISDSPIYGYVMLAGRIIASAGPNSDPDELLHDLGGQLDAIRDLFWPPERSLRKNHRGEVTGWNGGKR